MVTIDLDGLSIEDIDLVIFDKDGTLVDLYHYWSQMVFMRSELICQKLDLDNSHKQNLDFEMGVNEDEKRLRENGPVGIKKREVVMQKGIDYLESLGFKDTYKLCDDVFMEVDKWSSGVLPQLIEPINGLFELMDALYHGSCKVAIATTDRTNRAELIMTHLNLSDKVDYIIGADMVDEGKPAPEMIEKTLKALSIAKKNAVMVGDAVTDVEMGLNAGLGATVGVCTGLTAKEKLLEKTKYVVNDISEIRIVG